jgi:hypothetical protein
LIGRHLRKDEVDRLRTAERVTSRSGAIWPNLLFLAVVVALPILGLAATSAFVQLAKERSGETLRAVSGSVDALDVKVQALSAQVDLLWHEAADNRAGLAALQAETAATSRVQRTLSDSLDAGRKERAADAAAQTRTMAELRDALAGLRVDLGKDAQALPPLREDVGRLRREISAALDTMREDAGKTHAALTDLQQKLADQAAEPSGAAALERLADFVSQILTLRREAQADRERIEALEGKVAALSQAGSGTEPPAASLPYRIDETGKADQAPEPAEAPDRSQSTAAIAALPEAVTPHVILRYAPGEETARARAASLEQDFRKDGLDFVKSETVPTGTQDNVVIYYYAEDRPQAERIATDAETGSPVQHRFSEDESLPRPGTIEVTIVR